MTSTINKPMTIAVIGAGYGDETKGRTVNQVVARLKELGGPVTVVRHNGGAQAGHTVLLPGGQRHVFSHFGSGTLLGAATYWSEFCVVEPSTFLREHRELATNFGIKPTVHMHRDCQITTPWDIFLNRTQEESMGDLRRGSVGLGFNQTLRRKATLSLTIKDVMEMNAETLKGRIRAIQNASIGALVKYPKYDKDVYKTLISDGVVPGFYNRLRDLFGKINVINSARQAELVFAEHHLVFEGAQGLLLDEFYGNYPFVTPSRTGMPNATTIIRSMPNRQFDEVIYVTRLYATRHGADPGFTPTDISKYFEVQDQTNTTNKYQGTMVFDYLDLDKMWAAISYDCVHHDCPVISLAVSCFDQLNHPDEIPILFETVRSRHLELTHQQFLDELFDIDAEFNITLNGVYLGISETLTTYIDQDEYEEMCAACVEVPDEDELSYASTARFNEAVNG